MDPEEYFAHALLALEPEKEVGGSKSRQDWLRLVLQVQMFLHEHERNVKRFRSVLLDSPLEEEDND